MDRNLYMPQRLKAKLDHISQVPVTVVFAPTGYGKTALLSKWARESGQQLLWADVEDLTPQKGYARFCLALAQAGVPQAERLAQLGFPSYSNCYEIAALLRQCDRADEPLILLLDHFHCLQNQLPEPVLTALLQHESQQLHLVLLTDYLWNSFLYGQQRAALITPEDFSLRPGDITAYFAGEGIQLPPLEAERIYAVTGGWNIAVFLHLNQYLKFGSSINDSSTLQLIEELIWNHFNLEMKQCLLRLAPFDTFSLETIAWVLDQNEVPETISDTLKATPLIYYDPLSRVFYPHRIVMDFFRSALDCRPADLRTEIYSRAADYCLKHQNWDQALRFYQEAGQPSAVMQIAPRQLYQVLRRQPGLVEFVGQSLAELAPAALSQQPLLYLSFFRFAAESGRTELQPALLAQLRQLAGQGQDPQVKAQLLLLDTVKPVQDPDCLARLYQAAASCLLQNPAGTMPADPQPPPDCFMTADQAFLPAFPSLLDFGMTDAGRADQAAEQLQQAAAAWAVICGRQPAPAAVFYQAELALWRGQFDEALILTYQSEQQAQAAGYTQMAAAAQLLRGLTGLLRQDTGLIKDSLDSSARFLEQLDPELREGQTALPAAETGSRLLLARAADLLQQAAAMRHLMIRPCRLSPTALWQHEPADRWPGYPSLQRNLTLLEAAHYLQTDQPARLIALLNSLQAEAPAAASSARLLYQLASTVMLTLGYADLGQKQAAAMHLARALELAQAADLRLPFISYDARLAAFAPASLYKEIQLWLKPPITSQTPPAAAGINQLTAREREIARLAGLGLRNKEIAQQLYISQGTVRNHLNEVFQKLGIDRRGSLKDYLDQL